MKVLWFTNVMMPEFASALGLGAVNVGGWMPMLARALAAYAPDVELTIACKSPHAAVRDVQGVRHVALGPDVASEAMRLVRERSPDVVHVHGTETIALELPDEIIGGAHTLVSLQGVISGCCHHYDGNLTTSDLKPDRNRLKEWLRHTGLFQIQQGWIERRAVCERDVFRKARHFAGRTEWDRAWTRYLNPEAHYSVVGELLREPFMRGRRSDLDVIPHQIYCSAAVSYPMKGCHWLLQALAALKRQYPDVSLHVAAGAVANRPASFAARLRWGDYHRHVWRLIRELGLAENVRLLDSLDAEQVAQELREADVFCLPSLCENSPNSLAEAMAMGVPSVATCVGGIPSVLKDGVEGSLVPSGDPAILAEAIARYFSDRTFAGRCADQAHATAVRRHDPATVVAQLLSVYRDVAGATA